MGWSSGMKVRFVEAVPISEVLRTLREAGWRFPEGQFCWELDLLRSDGPVHPPRSVPEAEWEAAMPHLEAHVQEGGEVHTTLVWEGPDSSEPVFLSCAIMSPDILQFFPDQGAFHLEPDLPLLDFSRLLRMTVVPLVRSGMHLSDVDCCQGGKNRADSKRA